MLMGVAFVPVYLRVLGIEAYGLIGFFLSLQVFFAVLDMGLSATLNRELARHRHSGSDADAQRDLVRTLEWLYWPTGLLIAVGVFALSGFIAAHWLHPVRLSTGETAHAIALMGVSAGLQWPCGFYAGGFRGLERQVALNGLNAFFATLRHGGVALVLLYLAPTLEAFLYWQIGVSTLQTMASGAYLWWLLPTGNRAPEFRLQRLREVQGFALSLAAIAALSFVLTQSDRLLLATLLPLDELGYYTLAATLAAALSTVALPFVAALYPRYSGLVAAGEDEKLRLLYRQSTQLLVVVLASAAAVVVFFSADLLRLWTHNLRIASNSGVILSILVTGTALNGLLSLPYALQLAHGRTRLALVMNIVSVLFVVPAIWWLGSRYGGPGAAAVWVALNLAYVAIGVPLMHRQVIAIGMRDWYLRDVLPPALSAVAVAAALRLAVPTLPDGPWGVVLFCAIAGMVLLVAALSAPAARTILQRRPLA